MCDVSGATDKKVNIYLTGNLGKESQVSIKLVIWKPSGYIVSSLIWLPCDSANPVGIRMPVNVPVYVISPNETPWDETSI